MTLLERMKLELEYNPITGLFKWRYTGKGRRNDLRAGTKNPFGYLVITFEFQRYMAHILAWAFIHGEFPDKEMDHINRDPTDNRIENLRLVTHGQNLANSKTRTDNTSGERGVCWDKQKNKWKVQMNLGATRRYQKHFLT